MKLKDMDMWEWKATIEALLEHEPVLTFTIDRANGVVEINGLGFDDQDQLDDYLIAKYS